VASLPKQLRYFFLDVDNQLSLGQTREQASILSAQVGQFLGQWVGWGSFGTAWLGRERLELTSRTQAPPLDQVGGVQAFAPE
jgi:hypothetical protein